MSPITDAELEQLLIDILDVYGYDFTEYAQASLRRRIVRLFSLDRYQSFSEFRHRIKSDSSYFRRFIEEVTVNVTEMFRHPAFFRTLRLEVLPILSTYPFIRIWHAGCATGEEAYSMAILLKEANLLHKSVIYATDISPAAIKRASSGLVPMQYMRQYAQNYLDAGGLVNFSDYYTAGNNKALIRHDLRKNIVFSTHNLVAETSFNQFQLICCRNVLIYFDKSLQRRVFDLFDSSLERLGFLALGAKESMRTANCYGNYKAIGMEKIWRKME